MNEIHTCVHKSHDMSPGRQHCVQSNKHQRVIDNLLQCPPSPPTDCIRAGLFVWRLGGIIRTVLCCTVYDFTYYCCAQLIGWEDWLQNDLFHVKLDVKQWLIVFWGPPALMSLRAFLVARQLCSLCTENV